MPLEVKLTPKLAYKLRLSPQMKLSLNLLQLPLVKLKEFLIEQLEKNPLLESLDTNSVPADKQISDIKQDEIESQITTSPTLQEHLLKQLYLLTYTDEERKIGEEIIGNIDDNGYLRCAIEEIAESSKTTKSQAEKVLSLIQTFEPMGIGARDLRECLLLQLRAKQEENSLAGQIVDKYLSFLEKRRYKFIAKKLSAKGGSASGGKVSVDEIKEAMKEIADLEPKPGRSFSRERTVRLIPDAILKKNKEGYEIILNDWELPRITINEKYQKMIKQEETSSEVKKYLLERLNAAKALVGAIGKRRETVQKVIEDIISFQKDALDIGLTNFKPLNLSQIANRIGKHKSTVSRAIANKYIQTPSGIWELRHFLNWGIKQENGKFYSSKNIKLKISEWVRNEDKRKPLTDQDMVNLFKENGISVSRRTIAKYRTQAKILPSQSRQE